MPLSVVMQYSKFKVLISELTTHNHQLPMLNLITTLLPNLVKKF